jgi:hypothetical protein
MSYPYPLIVTPDFKSALIAHLRTKTDLTNVVTADHIVGRVPDYDGVQTANWLAIINIGGRDDFHYSTPILHPHLEAHCMGTSGYESMRIWRYLKAVLEHPSYRMQGFVSQGLSVYDIRVGLPIEVPDLGIRTWDKRVAPIYMVANEVPIS